MSKGRFLVDSLQFFFVLKDKWFAPDGSDAMCTEADGFHHNQLWRDFKISKVKMASL